MNACAPACLCLALAATGCADGQPPATVPSRSQAPQALAGKVVESGTAAPVLAARVCLRLSSNGDEHGVDCAETGADGSYRLTFTSPPLGNCPWVYAEEFEGRQDCLAAFKSAVTTWNPIVQRAIRIKAGEAIASTIFVNEKVMSTDEYCTPCKIVRIVGARAGRVTVGVTPANVGIRLAFWYGDQRANEPYVVHAGQELPVTVMSAIAPQSFELSTSFEPD
jgi:hypothetical protein